MPFTIKFIAASAQLALVLAGFTSVAQAQQVYRIVGPDGSVTFADQPPPITSNAKVTTGIGSRNGTDNSAAPLPLELRNAASKYPVTLYSGNNCNPCTAGKAMLVARGIPFNEKTVTTPEDSAALQRVSGENTLPFLTIGGQQIKGYSSEEWGQYLDAAGYPNTSQLPGNYRNPAPAPLVAVKKPEAAAGADASGASGANNTRRAAAQAAPSEPAPSNPAGIKF